MSESILETKNITRTFGGVKAVDTVNFIVNSGEIRGLIGPNGAGKTTFFNLLTSILKPSSGKCIFQGKDITNLDPYLVTSFGICRTFQNIELFRECTVLDNVKVSQNFKYKISIWDSIFNTKKYNKIEKEALLIAKKYIDFVGLKNKENELAKNLSYGQQRLLEIARALATEPKLLLLDEPAAGMNSNEIKKLVKLLMSIQNIGITMILIEHNMKLAMTVCNYITVLDSGKVIAEGEPIEIQNNKKVIEAYLGKEHVGVKN